VKLLFRYFRGTETKWPNQELKSAVEKCYDALRVFVERQLDDVFQDIFQSAISYKGLRKFDADFAKREEQDEIIDPCPLDLFYYKNSILDNHTSNCDAHCDRGLMHIVISNTCGLQVLDRETNTWQDTLGEAAFDRGDPTDSPLKRLKVNQGAAQCSHAVIFSNVMLQDLSTMAIEGAPVVALPACVHRVVHGSNPRLSISMELRLKNESPEFLEQLKQYIQVAQRAEDTGPATDETQDRSSARWRHVMKEKEDGAERAESGSGAGWSNI
jgi:hypothetical protein